MSTALRTAIVRIAMDCRAEEAALGSAHAPPRLMFEQHCADDVRTAIEHVLGEPERESGADGLTLRSYHWPALSLLVVLWGEAEGKVAAA